MRTPGSPSLRRRNGARLAAVIAAIAGMMTTSTVAFSAVGATPPASAVGNETVFWLASVRGRPTDVFAVTTPARVCKLDCRRLWTTNDGAGTWHRVGAKGWLGGPVEAAIAPDGRETLVANSPEGVQRSDDGGETWHVVGPAGVPTFGHEFAKDGQVLVAGAMNYRLIANRISAVAGSASRHADYAFASVSARGSTFSSTLLVAVDPRSGGLVVLRCDAHFECAGDGAALDGAKASDEPVSVLASSDYDHDGTVYVRSSHGVYKSTDGGSSFRLLQIMDGQGPAVSYAMLALTPGYREGGRDQIAYVSVLRRAKNPTPGQGLFEGGIYRTSDGGATWQKYGRRSALDLGATAVAIVANGTVLGAYFPTKSFAGLVCSRDGDVWGTSCGDPGSGSRTNQRTLWVTVGGAAVLLLGLVLGGVVVARGRARRVDKLPRS